MILRFDLGNLMFQDRRTNYWTSMPRLTVAMHDFRSGVEETANEIDGYLERILERRSHAKSKRKEKSTDKDQKEAKEIEQCKAHRDATMKELKSKEIFWYQIWYTITCKFQIYSSTRLAIVRGFDPYTVMTSSLNNRV